MLLLLRLVSLFAILLLSASAVSHPEDEFCNEGGLDPSLCAELASLDAEQAPSTAPTQRISRSLQETFLFYCRLGIEHILPDGIDHLLFILALLLATPTIKPLLLQISLFTVAHTITLILTVFGWGGFSGNWIEVLIALSIAFVAFESLFTKHIMPWRYPVIFLFGLLHGLGFSGALLEFGLPQGQTLSALLGFNLGVEIGQLLFAFVVFLLLFKSFDKSWYRKMMLIPSSLAIAGIALFWTWQRLI